MTTSKLAPPWQRALILQSSIITAALIIGLLYWARAILIPIAMAVFFSYVLAPVVNTLSRRGLGKGLSVITTVSVAVILVLGTSFILTQQISSLSQTLTENAETMKTKIGSARDALIGDGNSKLQDLFNDLQEMIVGDVTERRFARSVVIEPTRPKWMASIDSVIGPVTEAFGMAAFSFVLVVFILLAKEDLRDRMLRLIGNGAMPKTTRAIDEATRRISQYLFAQLVLNLTFGIIVAIAFWLIGVQYALLWGFVAAMFRYVPYIGTWIGIIPPALFTLATTQGWGLTIAVVGVYAFLEIFSNNIIEPRLYGSKLGVSEVAQLVAAGFWSFIWGPIGLILSGPISTCLVVLGRHSPRFRFFEILLGTEPPLKSHIALFQRMLTGDIDEAIAVIEKNKPEGKPEEVYDTVVLPALVQMKNSIRTGEFSDEEVATILDSTREIISTSLQDFTKELPEKGIVTNAKRLLVIPAKDPTDQLALDILATLLPPDRWIVQTATVDTLAAELIDQVDSFKPDAVCICTLPPTGLVQVRYLCKRLRQHNPQLRILIGRWSSIAEPESFGELIQAGATAVDVSLMETIHQLDEWRPLVVESESSPTPNSPNPLGTKTAEELSAKVVT